MTINYSECANWVIAQTDILKQSLLTETNRSTMFHASLVFSAYGHFCDLVVGHESNNPYDMIVLHLLMHIVDGSMPAHHARHLAEYSDYLENELLIEIVRNARVMGIIA